MLTDMHSATPDRKVGLVTFNREVTIIGDGSKAAVTIAGDKLSDYDLLMKTATELGQQQFEKTIKDTHKELHNKLLQIEENGPTALGPAILSSVALAAQGAPGSTVIVCTDGLANIGLGAFDDIYCEE